MPDATADTCLIESFFVRFCLTDASLLHHAAASLNDLYLDVGYRRCGRAGGRLSFSTDERCVLLASQQHQPASQRSTAATNPLIELFFAQPRYHSTL